MGSWGPQGLRLLRPILQQRSHPRTCTQRSVPAAPGHGGCSPQLHWRANGASSPRRVPCSPWGRPLPARPAETLFPGSSFALFPSAAESFPSLPVLPLPAAAPTVQVCPAVPNGSFLWLAKALKCCERGAALEMLPLSPGRGQPQWDTFPSCSASPLLQPRAESPSPAPWGHHGSLLLGQIHHPAPEKAPEHVGSSFCPCGAALGRSPELLAGAGPIPGWAWGAGRCGPVASVQGSGQRGATMSGCGKSSGLLSAFPPARGSHTGPHCLPCPRVEG